MNIRFARSSSLRPARHVVAALALLLFSSCAGNGDGSGAVDMAACSGQGCLSLCRTDGECQAGLRCHPVQHVCVACVADTDCAPHEICSPSTSQCVPGCSTVHGCDVAGQVCEADAGTCVECTRDGDCHDPGRPRCDAAGHHCVPCLPEADNCGHAKYCALQLGDHLCIPGCKADSDCDARGGDGGSAGHCDLAAHRCVFCAADGDCGPGTICRDGDCVDGCSANRPCAGGLACCNGACSDVTTDRANCGACGTACPGGWTCCRSTCANPADDLMNCGGCGVVCAVNHGKPACVLRGCAIASCDAGWDDCDGSFQDGCEAHTDASPINCGSCGNVCFFPHAQAACSAGACVIDTCLLPFQDCDGDAKNGCEANTGADVNNCGACKRVCKTPHATPDCVASACAVGVCDQGFADCNAIAKDGCESPVSSDVNNCGGCGVVCNAVNGVSSCKASMCTIACNGGWGNCDMSFANGCEVNLLVDAMNCGGCGNTCGGPHVTKSTCLAGGCKITACDFGFGDCNGDPRDGCEANLLGDVKNCGICSSTCSSNHVAPACGVGLCNGACDQGWDDCDGNKQTNGCESDTTKDINNCGGCNKVCPMPANATPTCANSTCGYTCAANFADCDKDAANGCEVNLLADAKNCGSCGNACNSGNCGGGMCTGLTIQVEGHADVVVPCNVGDYDCQAHYVCNIVTNSQCIHQGYCCCSPCNNGSWYPPDGSGGTSAFNFASDYDFCPNSQNYGNICACQLNEMQRYGLAANHSNCGYGHWTRR